MINNVYSQIQYRYVVSLKDKGDDVTALLESPHLYLSERSIARRVKQGISVDSLDIPVKKEYVDIIAQYGKVVGCSKWHNSVMLGVEDKNIIHELEEYDFVDSIYLVGTYTYENIEDVSCEESIGYYSDEKYGALSPAIHVNNIDMLHNLGFRGEDMIIAVTDDGFCNIDKIEGNWINRIISVRDFVNGNDDNIYKLGGHGTRVFSCIASNRDNVIVGAAPDANYVLLRTEYLDAEQPAEEFYWTFAAEYSDSIGADIMNVSLGYNIYDDGFPSYSYSDITGSSVISTSADIAVSRGMVVICSAGNEGNKSWEKITVPADGVYVVSVGALKDNGFDVAAYSSRGPSFDQRIKPDVMSLGTVLSVANSGILSTGIGTSFASPIVAGGTACLWQALNEKSSYEIVAMLKASSNCYANPDSLMGYGIVDFIKAYNDNSESDVENEYCDNIIINGNNIYVSNILLPMEAYIYSISGVLLSSFKVNNTYCELPYLPKGMYIIQFHSKRFNYSIKILI